MTPKPLYEIVENMQFTVKNKKNKNSNPPHFLLSRLSTIGELCGKHLWQIVFLTMVLFIRSLNWKESLTSLGMRIFRFKPKFRFFLVQNVRYFIYFQISACLMPASLLSIREGLISHILWPLRRVVRRERQLLIICERSKVSRQACLLKLRNSKLFNFFYYSVLMIF